MAYINDLIFDEALSYLRTNGDILCLCSALPTTYAEAGSTYALATAPLGTASYTLANGDTSGRKATVSAATAVTVIDSGDTAYAAINSSGGTALLLVATCSAQTLTSGNTVNTTAFDFEFRDAADE